MSVINNFLITFLNKKVGEDILGNKYYESKKLDYLGHTKRFVLYHKENEHLRIPPNWHAWLHHMVREVPDPKNACKVTEAYHAYSPPVHIKKSETTAYNRWRP